jgi:hypothetical protein
VVHLEVPAKGTGDERIDIVGIGDASDMVQGFKREMGKLRVLRHTNIIGS